MEILKKILTLAILSFVLLFLGSLAFASNRHWEFAGWYGGGCYPNAAFDIHIKGRVYLTSDVAGLWRSDDGGEHWHFKTKGLGQLTVPQVAVAPSDSNVLYAATGGGIYVSKNSGDSWEAADNAQGKIIFKRPENYRPIAVDPQNPNELCVGTARAQVFCSQDFGRQWKDIDPDRKFFSDPTDISALAFDKQGRLYIASNKGLSRCGSRAGGCRSLTGAPSPITDLIFSQKSPAVLFAAGEDALWISHDNGDSWETTNPIPQGKTYRIALDESGEIPVIRVIWSKDWKGGVFMTRDEGKTWESQDDNLNADRLSDPTRGWAANGGRSNTVQVDPFDPQIVLRSDWWGVWRSDDGGKSWNEKIVGAPDSVATQIVMDADGEIYVSSMDNGLLRSHDGGKTYEMLFPRKYDAAESGHVWRIAVSGNTIVGTSSPWGETVNQVIDSHDSGNSFSLVRDGLPSGRPKANTMWGEGYPRGLAMDPNNPDIIYLGIDGDGGGLFVSNDMGGTWRRSQGQPGSLRIYNGLAVDPTDSKRIIWGACSTGGGVYVSEDAGRTFDLREKQMDWVFDVAIASDGSMYAAGDSNGAKLFASGDHGQTWVMTGDFGKDRALGTVAVDPNDPQHVAVGTVSWGNKPCNIFLSIDGAKTWQDITADLPDGAGAASIIFDPRGKYLYIARYAGSVYRLALK